MILCEKCTKSTVAKHLKDSMVLEDLVFNFGEILKRIKQTHTLYDTQGRNLNTD